MFAASFFFVIVLVRGGCSFPFPSLPFTLVLGAVLTVEREEARERKRGQGRDASCSCCCLECSCSCDC